MTQARFGKHAAKNDYRTLRLKNYLTSALPPAPPALNVLAQVAAELKTTDVLPLFPMDGNDTYGDCTIAALAHAETVYNGLVGIKNVMAQKDILKLYFKLTGGKDTGLNELDVLSAWKALKGDNHIVAYAKVSIKDHAHVKSAIQLFGGVYLGFQVQENAIKDFDARKTWTPGKLTNDGHAVYATGYDTHGVTLLTWGNTQQATWEWWDECVDEAYAILPYQALTAGFAPGFNYKQLQEDLADITG